MQLVRNQKQAPLPERQQSRRLHRTPNISSTDGGICPLSLRGIQQVETSRANHRDRQGNRPPGGFPTGRRGEIPQGLACNPSEGELTETSIQLTTSAPRRAPSIQPPPLLSLLLPYAIHSPPFYRTPCNDDQPHSWQDQTPAASELHIPPS